MSSEFGTGRDDAPSLAVVGGGLAGIAAAEAASREGFRVHLFEWSRVLGGRAASLYDPVAGQWIDNGQHLTMGCCTELSALHSRLGLDDFFERRDAIPFAQVGGKRWTMSAASYLPNRWQLVPAFLRIPFLSFRDRLATGLLMRKLERTPSPDWERKDLGAKDISPESARRRRGSFADWLDRQRASKDSIEHFWAPLVFSALSETLENACFEAVRKVVLDGFLAGKNAMALHVPKVPLRSIYHRAVAERLRNAGVKLHLLSRVRRLNWEFDRSASGVDENPGIPGIPRVLSLETVGGETSTFDRYVLAVPVHRIWKLLEASDLDVYAERLGLDRFESGAITTVHLWFDRPILESGNSHSALLDGPGQFLFCMKDATGKNPAQGFVPEKIDGFYHTVVISASHRVLPEEEFSPQGNSALSQRILEQLRRTFPEAFQGRSGENRKPIRLLHSRITTFFDAVFSPGPEIYTTRPSQRTPFSNLALAGDWTQTFWPSTLEGAVRSGLEAVRVLSEWDDEEESG